MGQRRQTQRQWQTASPLQDWRHQGHLSSPVGRNSQNGDYSPDGDWQWFVAISCEWEPTPLPSTGKAVGIDVGLRTFATLSTVDEIENPCFFRTEEKALAKAQRKHQMSLDAHKAMHADATTRMKRAHPELDEASIWQAVTQDAEERASWKQRQKRRKIVARVHERTRWKRKNFAHQHSRRIVNAFDMIAVEDLSVRSMIQKGRRAKSIHDAAWNQFRELIACKAGRAGRRYVAVNPAYTSQDCSGCGNRNVDLTLAVRVYRCVRCGLIIDRDHNAALNILAVGRHCLGLVS